MLSNKGSNTDSANNQSLGNLFSITQIEDFSITCVRAAYQRLLELGDDGRQKREINQFGEGQLLADWEIEEAIIKLAIDQKFPARFISEEHKQLQITDSPIFTITLDGLDGSNLYLANKSDARFCHMLSIHSGSSHSGSSHSGSSPTYNDYLVSGILDLRSGQLLFAIKNQGVFIQQIEAAKDEKNKVLTKPSPSITELKAVFSHKEICTQCQIPWEPQTRFNISDIACLGAKYTDLALGKVDAMIEGTRKDNLEHIIGYGILRELGGDIVDMNGLSLADQKIEIFGNPEHVGIIAARSITLATELAAFLSPR